MLSESTQERENDTWGQNEKAIVVDECRKFPVYSNFASVFSLGSRISLLSTSGVGGNHMLGVVLIFGTLS